jgi:hypothetical protein
MRSYSSAATTLTERTNVMANLSAYQGVGFILGPRKFNYSSTKICLRLIYIYIIFYI